jgi:hypothetical protein
MDLGFLDDPPPSDSCQVLSSTMPLLPMSLNLLKHNQATYVWVFSFSESLQAGRSLFL